MSWPQPNALWQLVCVVLHVLQAPLCMPLSHACQKAEQISIYFNIGSCRLGPLSASAEHCTSQARSFSAERSQISEIVSFGGL